MIMSLPFPLLLPLHPAPQLQNWRLSMLRSVPPKRLPSQHKLTKRPVREQPNQRSKSVAGLWVRGAWDWVRSFRSWLVCFSASGVKLCSDSPWRTMCSVLLVASGSHALASRLLVCHFSIISGLFKTEITGIRGKFCIFLFKTPERMLK